MPILDDISATSSSATKQPNGYSELSSGDFTKIILSELNRQDPLAPNDTSKLVEQLATIRSIQSDVDLSERLGQLVNHDEFAAAAGLMGKRVSGVSDLFGRVEGRVAGVSRTERGSVVSLENGVEIRFGQVDEVIQSEEVLG